MINATKAHELSTQNAIPQQQFLEKQLIDIEDQINRAIQSGLLEIRTEYLYPTTQKVLRNNSYIVTKYDGYFIVKW